MDTHGIAISTAAVQNTSARQMPPLPLDHHVLREKEKSIRPAQYSFQGIFKRNERPGVVIFSI
jgi:hypothetical protein